MASSTFHKAKQRRVERQSAHGHGNINLIPLVDVLTSIVFFSLMTYTGASMANLTSFDLALPPVVITGDPPGSPAPPKDILTLLLAVRIKEDGGGVLRVEHSEENGFRQEIRGYRGASLDQFEQLMAQIKTKYPQNSDVSVIPDDGVQYDDVIQVLDRLKKLKYTGIALASRARDEKKISIAGVQ
jgi:biopolymer transport protein ExbD